MPEWFPRFLMPFFSGLLLASPVFAGGAVGQDDDGDGLSNFHETYKYFTDPGDADSDGDSIPDGDWRERREYAYTIRAVIKVRRPVNEGVLTDDRQDGRVVRETEDFVEIEFILYPFNRVADSIAANPNWRSDDSFREFVEPGPTTNWDRGMRNEMLSSLREAGVNVRRLDDVQTVKKVSAWLMRRVEHLNSSSYAIVFDGGRPSVLPEHRDGFESIMWDRNGSVEDQFQRELYGKGIFENRLTGSCTSCANYLTTGLRAVGIPTRMVRAIPIADCSDPEQIRMVEEGITNETIREGLLPAVRNGGKGFTAHTYNEVYVGGRWRRLNYTNLGQNNFDRDFLGIMIHIDRYGDLAHATIGEWGRWLTAARREPFLHSNPYRLVEVSDQAARHKRPDHE